MRQSGCNNVESLLAYVCIRTSLATIDVSLLMNSFDLYNYIHTFIPIVPQAC